MQNKRFAPRDGLPYSGPETLPSWFREGAQVRVKACSCTRLKSGGRGLPTRGALSPHDCVAWSGEIGTIHVWRRESDAGGEGCWGFYVLFERGREVRALVDSEIELLVPHRTKP